MTEKCFHPPHARNICPQGVCGHGHRGFFTSCFSGMGPQCPSSPPPCPLLVPACCSSRSAWADLWLLWLLQETKLLLLSLGPEAGGGRKGPLWLGIGHQSGESFAAPVPPLA